jgi:hypothetical protein
MVIDTDPKEPRPAMTPPTMTEWRARLFFAGCAAAFAVAALTAAPRPAEARVWVSVGVPFPGYYYGSGPNYGYYPPPYAYAPPPGYYPPAGYPAPGAYPPPAGPSPSAYTPGAPATAPAIPAQPKVTYTNKPAFTNSAGQTCREYKATDTTNRRPVDVFGTACQQADGQWRVIY